MTSKSGIVRSYKASLRRLVHNPHSSLRQHQTFQNVIARDKNRNSFYRIKRFYSSFENNDNKIFIEDFDLF